MARRKNGNANGNGKRLATWQPVDQAVDIMRRGRRLPRPRRSRMRSTASRPPTRTASPKWVNARRENCWPSSRQEPEISEALCLLRLGSEMKQT